MIYGLLDIIHAVLPRYLKCLIKEMEQYNKILDGFLKEMGTRDDDEENG